MNVREAIMAFTQSEKIKSGLIWASNGIELLQGLSMTEKPGAENVVRGLINMVFHEVSISKNIAPDRIWEEVEKNMDQALVMLNSGVASESLVHLTQALSKVTSVGHRSMTFLKDEGFL
jgi:hypothetical protein